jgi:hypothetical protein
MTQEQVRVGLEQAKNARRESESSRKASIMEYAKLGKLLSQVLTNLEFLLGQCSPTRF